MIFFFNAQGDTINFVPENVHQGSNNANKVYVVAPLSEANQVLAYFTLPNGNVVQPVYGSTTNGLTNLDNLQIEGKSYTVWVCSLSDIITSIAGTVKVQFVFINESQKIRTQSNEFYISEGASPYEPLDISTETTWDEILAYISNFVINFNNLEQDINEKFENLSTEIEKDFEELTNEIKGDLENGVYPVNYDTATNRPIFNVELPINNPTMGYYRHVGESTDKFISGGLYYFDGANFSLLATEKTAKEYTDKEIATVNQKIDTLHSNAFVSVDTLPTASAETLGKIYLVPTANPNEVNVKNEYITIEVDGNYFWEVIGSTAINLSGKTAVTVGGVVQETWDADTKVDRMTDNPGGIFLYGQNGNKKETQYTVANVTGSMANGKIPMYFAKTSTQGDNKPVGVMISGNPEKPYHVANKNYADAVSKYYMHEIQIQSMTLMGFIVLQVLSRQPNMYTSLADMVADTTLILPRVADWNNQGDPKIALNPSITDTSITWTEDGSGGAIHTIETTDNEYGFYDTVKPYEIPTT